MRGGEEDWSFYGARIQAGAGPLVCAGTAAAGSRNRKMEGGRGEGSEGGRKGREGNDPDGIDSIVLRGEVERSVVVNGLGLRYVLHLDGVKLLETRQKRSTCKSALAASRVLNTATCPARAAS